jgi:Protein of unknown function (DUF1631)
MADTYNSTISQMKAIKDNSTVISEFINGDGENAGGVKKLRPKGSKHVLPRNDVIEALSKLQPIYKSEYVAGQKTNINTDSFKSALLNSVAKINPSSATRSVNQIDGRTIDFVEMIFGAFLRDKNISLAIKSLLLKLQIPVIKIAMLDTKFFYNHKHPARNVLDEIAHIGIGVDDPEDTVLKTISLIINQLLNSFDKNIISFHTSLKALIRLRNIEQGKLDENEQQTKKNILKEHARQSVLSSLQFHIGKTALPKAMQTLILKQWSTLMFQTFIRCGKDSDQWNECTDILSKMITGIKKSECHEDLFLIKDIQDDIHLRAENLLRETKINKELIHNSTNALRITIKKNIALSEKYLETKSVDDNQTSRQNIIDPGKQALKLAKDKIDNMPEYIKPGNWFEVFINESQTIRRLKLSVILTDSARLIFVDRMGIKVTEKDAVEFSKEIKYKNSQLLADHSIFNHALSNVIMSLSAQS